MKFKTNLLFACFIFMSLNVFAQLSQDTRQNLPTAEQYKKIKKYNSTITLDSQEKIKGILYKVTDESIILLPKDKDIKRYSHFVNLAYKEQVVIDMISIKSVKTRKNGKLVRNLLIGVGVFVGSIVVGQAVISNRGKTFSNFFKNINSAAGFTFLGIAGGLTGIIVGITSNSYNIKRNDKTRFQRLKKKGIMYGY